MKIEFGKPFRIPRRLGDRFKEVVSIRGVKYIRQEGFVVDNKAALDSLNRILIKMGLILVPLIRCFLCGKDIDCDNCNFKDVCRREVSTCICSSCLDDRDVLSKYFDTQKRLLSMNQ
jgi:hypothetical protein